MTANPARPLYVLAGGNSSRFGSDKALAEVGGVSLVSAVVFAFCDPMSSSATLVTGSEPRYTDLGYRVVTDRPAGVGPLGGLSAALHDRLSHAGPGWVLIASCDLVHPRRSWADTLWRAAAADTTTARAVAYRGARWEPLLALYHTDLLAMIERQLDDGRYSLQALLDTAGALGVDLPDGLDSLPQANTPAQLARAIGDRGAA